MVEYKVQIAPCGVHPVAAHNCKLCRDCEIPDCEHREQRRIER